MASRVIHVGQDTCHRLAVLESAGYEVDSCLCITELEECLADREQPDAVLISEGAGGAHLDAVMLAREQTAAPIVLFRDTQRTFAEDSFDLVVPILLPPQTWLAEMAALIARYHAVGTSSQAFRGQAGELRHGNTAAREKSQKQRAGTEYGKKFPPPAG